MLPPKENFLVRRCPAGPLSYECRQSSPFHLPVVLLPARAFKVVSCRLAFGWKKQKQGLGFGPDYQLGLTGVHNQIFWGSVTFQQPINQGGLFKI